MPLRAAYHSIMQSEIHFGHFGSTYLNQRNTLQQEMMIEQEIPHSTWGKVTKQ